jgi:neopullulanase
MKRILLLFACSIVAVFGLAQSGYNCYPTNWWAGMKWNKVQVMIHGDAIANASGFSIAWPGIRLAKVHRVENNNYVFLDLVLAANVKPGMASIVVNGFTGVNKIPFEIKPRRAGNGKKFAQGVTSADLMYLIMPDRFSNGDPSNDRVPGMLDQTLNRDTVFNRHGGDLKGVQNHLDYLEELGVSTIWLNPVFENDRPERTEHGYAFTDHYKVDRRIGGEAAYQQLIDAMHARGMKMIQDAVYNHVDVNHFFIKDMPMKDWVHEWPAYTNTTYKDQTLFDPYVSAIDKKKLSDGWFVPQMADLNQNNPYLANFLIQHALWSVEQFGIDGWRIDTYAYNDLDFMNRCNKALYDEYPAITIFGETWVHGVPNQSYFCENNYNIPYKSNMQATTDFQLLFYGIQATLTQNFGWTDGVNKLYTTAAQDFVYKNPMRQVIFLDNHDIPRFYSIINEDTAKYKMAFAWLLTFRGIPQMYYGNEILMAGTTTPNDGYVRMDFPGGWPGDALNKFTAAGRTEKENSLFNYIKKLTNFRKKSSAIKTGKLMQYVPEDGVYVYFRYDKQQTIMCIMNQGPDEKEIDLDRFQERTKGFGKGRNVVTGTEMRIAGKTKVPGMSMQVLELRK